MIIFSSTLHVLRRHSCHAPAALVPCTCCTSTVHLHHVPCTFCTFHALATRTMNQLYLRYTCCTFHGPVVLTMHLLLLPCTGCISTVYLHSLHQHGAHADGAAAVPASAVHVLHPHRTTAAPVTCTSCIRIVHPLHLITVGAISQSGVDRRLCKCAGLFVFVC